MCIILSITLSCCVLFSISWSGRASVKRLNGCTVVAVDNAISYSGLAGHQSVDGQQRQTCDVRLGRRLWVLGAAAAAARVVTGSSGRPAGRHQQWGGRNSGDRCCRRRSVHCQEWHRRPSQLDDSGSSERWKAWEAWLVVVVMAGPFIYHRWKVCYVSSVSTLIGRTSQL